MATSGSIALTYTRDNIIQEALEQLGVVEPGGTPEAAHVTSMARTLEMMIKAWQTDGLQIHTVKRGYLFPAASQREYTLNSSSSDRWASSYVRTTVDGAVSSGAATIDVAAATGITGTYIIGVYQSDGTMLWTTVNGAPVGVAVTLTDVLTADVDDGAVVYCFPATAADRPMEIIEAWERDWEGNDRPVNIISREEYTQHTLKSNTGGLVDVFYDAQVSTPTLFVWPIPDDPRTIIGTWTKRTIESFTAADKDADFPQEAFLALAMNGAMWGMNKFGVDQITASRITALAGVAYKNYVDYATRPEADAQFEVDTGEGDDW